MSVRKEITLEDAFTSQLKQDVEQRYNQKYGHVFVDFDQIVPTGDNQAYLQFTLSDERGFITRYYGQAVYRGHALHLRTKAI